MAGLKAALKATGHTQASLRRLIASVAGRAPAAATMSRALSDGATSPSAAYLATIIHLLGLLRERPVATGTVHRD